MLFGRPVRQEPCGKKRSSPQFTKCPARLNQFPCSQFSSPDNQPTKSVSRSRQPFLFVPGFLGIGTRGNLTTLVLAIKEIVGDLGPKHMLLTSTVLGAGWQNMAAHEEVQHKARYSSIILPKKYSRRRSRCTALKALPCSSHVRPIHLSDFR